MTQTAATRRIDLNRPRTDRGPRLLAACCALVAGLTHAAIAPGQLELWRPAGVFFVVVAAAQLALVWCLRRRVPDPRVLAVAIAGTVGLVLFYVATRTVELSFLPTAHQVSHLPVAWGIGNGVPVFPGEGIKDVGFPDLVALVAELTLVPALCSLSPAGVRRRAASALMGIGLVLLALRLLGVLG
jgi:hypothetical protein